MSIYGLLILSSHCSLTRCCTQPHQHENGWQYETQLHGGSVRYELECSIHLCFVEVGWNTSNEGAPGLIYHSRRCHHQLTEGKQDVNSATVNSSQLRCDWTTMRQNCLACCDAGAVLGYKGRRDHSHTSCSEKTQQHSRSGSGSCHNDSHPLSMVVGTTGGGRGPSCIASQPAANNDLSPSPTGCSNQSAKRHATVFLRQQL